MGPQASSSHHLYLKVRFYWDIAMLICLHFICGWQSGVVEIDHVVCKPLSV